MEEIDELFERKISTWKFKTTKTNIMEAALKEVRNRDVGPTDMDSKMMVEPIELDEAVRKQ